MRKSPILALALVVISLCGAAYAADAEPKGVVNINTADVTQLALLPGVGAKAAQLIVDYRTEHGAFAKATDLMQVKGVGAKTFEGLSQYISVDGKTTLASKVSGPRKPRAKKPTSTASN